MNRSCLSLIIISHHSEAGKAWMYCLLNGIPDSGAARLTTIISNFDFHRTRSNHLCRLCIQQYHHNGQWRPSNHGFRPRSQPELLLRSRRLRLRLLCHLPTGVELRRRRLSRWFLLFDYQWWLRTGSIQWRLLPDFRDGWRVLNKQRAMRSHC